MQSRHVFLQETYSPRPEWHEIKVFQKGYPDRPFKKVARIDVHVEKTSFIGSSFKNALPELSKQARLSGADAIIDIQESSSMILETRVYHVSVTGIRYTD